jgi:hypothetical protein
VRRRLNLLEGFVRQRLLDRFFRVIRDLTLAGGYGGLDPAVQAIYFQHSEPASEIISKHFNGGAELVPRDDISKFVESYLSRRAVTMEGFAEYLARVPPHDRARLRSRIEALFVGQIPIEMGA